MELLARLIDAGCGGVAVILLARLLDPNGYGLLFLTLSVVGIAKLFAKLGLPESAARYISEYKERDSDQISHIIRISFMYLLCFVSIVSIFMLIGHQFIAERLGEPELAPFLLLGVLFLFFTVLSGYTRSILQAFESMRFAAIIKIIQGVGKLVFAVGLVILGLGAIGGLGGYVLKEFFAFVFGIIIIYSQYYRIFEGGSEMERGLKRRIAEYSIPLTMTQAADRLSGRIDTLLVGFFLNPAAVSFYVVSGQIISFIQTPVSALGFTISPTFGAEKAAGNLESAARLYETSLVHSLLLYTPAAAGIILVADPLVRLVFGLGYIDSVPVLRVLGVYMILSAIMNITSHGLDFLGQARARAIIMGVTSILNFGLNLVLIPLIGVVGAALATIITYSLYTFASVYIIHREFNLRLLYLLQKITWIFVITAAMSVVVFLLLDYIQGWISLIMISIIGVIVWGVLSILTGLLNIRNIIRTII